jgi:hypothetical protein
MVADSSPERAWNVNRPAVRLMEFDADPSVEVRSQARIAVFH